MARKRMIDPDFWLDEDVASMSPLARLLYIGTWNICDDNYATFPNRPDWIKAQIFPYEKDIDIPALLTELSRTNRLLLFQGKDTKEYWFIKNFFKHQTINRPSNPKYAKFSGTLPDGSVSTHPEVKEVNELNKGKVFIKNSRENLRDKWSKRK